MVGTFRYVSSAAFYCSAFAFKASLAGTLSVVRADQRLLLAIGSGALACHASGVAKIARVGLAGVGPSVSAAVSFVVSFA